ncbi:M23 family metallopeptidase [Magnetococcus sp. PR-3]|uniref:M23 family metallopeptidase n=1 Tax=Magnetococcus sp. PR-3 TaxID=3120355 RepID=UPI002FCE0EF3
MRKHFTITITTHEGAKHLRVSFSRLRAVVIVVMLGVGALLGSGALGVYFYKDAEKLQSRLTATRTDLSHLHSQNRELQQLSQNKDVVINQVQQKYQDAQAKADALVLAATNSERVKRYLLNRLPNGRPIYSRKITSGYGERVDPISSKREFHGGLDMRAPIGTTVRATADGVVEFAGNHKRSGYGHLVIVRHDFGFRTVYAHLSKTLVKAGAFVGKGDRIALSGNSGKSSGPHLHYEVRFVHRKLDPARFVSWRAENYDTIFEERRVRWHSLVNLLNRRLSDPAQPSLHLAQK